MPRKLLAEIQTKPKFSKVPSRLNPMIAAMQSVYPEVWTIEGSPTSPEVLANGKRVLQFSSPNYLGLSDDSRLIDAAIAATRYCGAGTSGSGIISGYTHLHRELELELASFMEEESAVFFNSVSIANAAITAGVFDPPMLKYVLHDLTPEQRRMKKSIFFDKENHASLWDAIRKVDVHKSHFYHHSNPDELEEMLADDSCEFKLIISDGYFSMGADIAPLPRLVDLAKRYDAAIFIDDAHGTGVLGRNGRGTAEHFDVEKEINFITGSTAKALGVRGGFVASDETFTRHLRINCKGYVFSGTEPPCVPGAILAALKIIQLEPWRRNRVIENAEYLRRNLQALGYSIMGEGHIVPWLIGSETKVQAISHALFQYGILAPAIRYPAVDMGAARVRFIPMATHTEQHMNTVLEACDVIGRQFDVSRWKSS
jgi:7-keto-8-aminopelargonate synthetase-like enzyme